MSRHDAYRLVGTTQCGAWFATDPRLSGGQPESCSGARPSPARHLEDRLSVQTAAGEVEEVLKKGGLVPFGQAERSCKGRDFLCDHTRVVVKVLERLDRDPCDGFGLDVAGQEVADHPARPGRGKAFEDDPLGVRDRSPVHPDVLPPSLPAPRHGEFMDVGADVADAVERCRGCMGNDCDVRVVETLPSRPIGIELEPCGPELEMVRLPSAAEAVDAMSDPLQYAALNEARESGVRDAACLRLGAGYEAPLALSEIDDE